MALIVDIQKKLGDFRLNASFSTSEGPLGILGASGSGKSVTLQCVAGLMKPDRGHIELNGKVLFDSSRHIFVSPQKRSIGYLFQSYALFPNMTVFENICAGARVGNRAVRAKMAEDALKTFHLEDVRDQYPHTLSGGQAQRTALARILIGKPDALLLDEPFSALDTYLREHLLWDLSRQLRSYEGDVLFVSHSHEEIRRLCPVSCVADQGQFEPVRKTADLLLHPKTAADAKLAGFRNIAPVIRSSGDTLYCPSWGLSFESDEAVSSPEAVCLPEDGLFFCGQNAPGAFPAVLRDHFTESGHSFLLLYPTRGQGDIPLCMRADFPVPENDTTVWIGILNSSPILLRNSVKPS